MNHLGLEVVYRPVNSPLPSDREMQGFRGVITWFDRFDVVPDADAYCLWLKAQIARARKLVILGEPGILRDENRTMTPACQEFFEAFGASYQAEFTENPFLLEVVLKDPHMVEFERKISLAEEPKYSIYKSRLPENKVYLKIKRRDLSESESDLVFAGPHGGFAHSSWVLYENPDLKKAHWRLNPFEFFNKAFGMDPLPRPDATTLNGRRIFFSHIDGDGIVNISHIDQKSFSGKIIYEEILRRLNLPIAVSLISGYFELPKYQAPAVTDLYAKILSLPNTEVASHTLSHPLVWKKGKLALDIPGYSFSENKEIDGSVGAIGDLIQSLHIDKKVRLFFWSGDCLPSHEAIARSYRLGLANLNGGNPRFDRRFDSYAFVRPLGILRGRYRQIYSAAPNENDYTNLWKGPYWGFRDVIETFKNTENPIRVKPINVYYHFYSGERMESLAALKQVYEYALNQEIFAVSVSEYAGLVHDFFEAQIYDLKDGFGFYHQGNLRTIRFDREARHVDFFRSKGVLGYRHDKGSLYVFLDESPLHEIYLRLDEPDRPYVREASFWIKNFKGNRQEAHFLKKGWHKSVITLGGMSPAANFIVKTQKENLRFRSDPRGRLKIAFRESEDTGDWTSVHVRVFE